MPHDDELRDLYRRLPSDEPRAEIDAKILSAARSGNARQSRTTLLRRIRWALPLAAAAGVVLTFALMRLAPERRLEGTDERAPEPATLERDASDDAARRPEDRVEVARPEARSAAGQRRARLDGDGGDAAPAGPAGPATIAAAPPPDPADPAAEQAATESKPGLAAAKKSNEASGPAGPASPPAEAAVAAQRHDLAACLADETDPVEAEARARALAEAEAARKEENAVEAARWPFGLEPWLDASEACRRAAAALSTTCEFHGSVAVLDADPPVPVDVGLSRGSPVRQLTLTLRDGRLAKVDLRFADAGARHTLIAPEPAP